MTRVCESGLRGRTTRFPEQRPTIIDYEPEWRMVPTCLYPYAIPTSFACPRNPMASPIWLGGSEQGGKSEFYIRGRQKRLHARRWFCRRLQASSRASDDCWGSSSGLTSRAAPSTRVNSVNLAGVVWKFQHDGSRDCVLSLFGPLLDAFGLFRHHDRAANELAERPGGTS